ncbi:hypothetical protein JW906_07660 [bacterium]|nr:hypothetical protein [bacterium]
MKDFNAQEYQYESVHSGGLVYTYSYGKRRVKSDWAGITLGDAFRANLDYYERLPAQRLFYQKVARIQKAICGLFDESGESAKQFLARPQIGPVYTQYPSSAAAYAAIGLTAFLEYQARMKDKILMVLLADFIESPDGDGDDSEDENQHSLLARTITKAVQVRILLEDLSRRPGLFPVEIYRLFAASQQDLRFLTMNDVIFSSVLYGDILPGWANLNLHPLTREIFGKMDAVSGSFFNSLPSVEAELLVDFGADWVKALYKAIVPLLPDTKQINQMQHDILNAKDRNNMSLQIVSREMGPLFGMEDETLPPLNEPQPPVLTDPENWVEHSAVLLLNSLFKNMPAQEEFMQQTQEMLFMAFVEAMRSAGAQQRAWEDTRSDILQRLLQLSLFEGGPMEGTPTGGQQIQVHVGGDDMEGEIFDRPVALSENAGACESLVADAQPLTDAMRRSLYPNIERLPETDRLRTSGSIDPARLAMADFSPAVFKRYRMREKADRRGRPVLAIACDGSGSLNPDQMRMLKLLTTAWLNSTARSDIQLLAGLYHSDQVRPGIAGPLVQWIYHPLKTPTTNRREAVRALVALPNTGTGVQSDALSIAYIVREAQALARGRMVYLILITDCEWNRSFRTKKTGFQEVEALLKTLIEDFKGKLHMTLVALGKKNPIGLENLVDKVILIPREELNNSAAVAAKVGLYVASCLRERNKLVLKENR